eukprot:m.85788 g.85788  ORF g.85788 m.85788 type:complete len:65 (+) comp36472_c0_seq4:1054-1248(+)
MNTGKQSHPFALSWLIMILTRDFQSGASVVNSLAKSQYPTAFLYLETCSAQKCMVLRLSSYKHC